MQSRDAPLSAGGGHAHLLYNPAIMDDTRTTIVVQRFLDELAGVKGDSPAEPIVRALLASAVDRLHLLCTTLLFRSYPRLTKPPLNLRADEMLSAVVERLLKAMWEVHPRPFASSSPWPIGTCVGSSMTWPDA
jgi:hypothetical protein